MSKTKSVFYCNNCGTQAAKWVGKCPACNEWNTFQEEVISKSMANTKVSNPDKLPELINADIQPLEERVFLPDIEFNRVLGGGLVCGSVVLIGGEPGIGKSTLLLQNMLHSNLKCLYVSGEESKSQVNLRALRIGIRNQQCYMLPENQLETILQASKKLNPDVLVIDSIQTMESSYLDSAPGSVSQVKECTSSLIKYAKSSDIPILIVGHINKDGNLAGPKVLEHMVDVVLQFEGEKNFYYRALRTQKNRFGSTNEIGLYEMTKEGLQAVTNPSEILVSDSTDNLSGVAICASVEGNTPMLIEVQALISPAVYGNPQRNATGFDMKRLGMLLAVLEKKGGIQLATKDVFVNITGGFKPDDPALDLAVVAAILSSFYDIPIPKTKAFAGEIGLSGEIRPAYRAENRISEAQKMGLSHIYISEFSKLPDSSNMGIAIKLLKSVDDLNLHIL